MSCWWCGFKLCCKWQNTPGKIYENLWVQPAAGDAGGSLGACLAYWHNELGNYRKQNINDSMKLGLLGPEYSMKNIKEELNNLGANFSEFTKQEVIDFTTSQLGKGKAIGWFQGKMEFGPRALGGLF